MKLSSRQLEALAVAAKKPSLIWEYSALTIAALIQRGCLRLKVGPRGRVAPVVTAWGRQLLKNPPRPWREALRDTTATKRGRKP